MSITAKDLFEAGVHFGHQTRRWNPKSKDFVFNNINGTSIIDLEKTVAQLQSAGDFIEDLVSRGKNILFVGTKKQAQEIVREAATSVSMPFCANRWLGGTLTNFETIKKSLDKFKRFQNMESSGEFDKMHKKELSVIRREMSRMERNFEGLQHMKTLPDALFVVDIKEEYIAVAEATRLGIPVIALVDTNSDPSLVTYPIPGNDDSEKSVRLIAETIVDRIQKGLDLKSARNADNKDAAPRARKDLSNANAEVTLAADIATDENVSSKE